MRCTWKKHCAILQLVYQTKIHRRIRDSNNDPCKVPNRSRSGRILSEGQGLKCIEIKSVVTIENGKYCMEMYQRGVTQWARQSSQLAPGIEGLDTVFVHRGTEVAQAQAEDPDLCIGRPISFSP